METIRQVFAGEKRVSPEIASALAEETVKSTSSASWGNLARAIGRTPWRSRHAAESFNCRRGGQARPYRGSFTYFSPSRNTTPAEYRVKPRQRIRQCYSGLEISRCRHRTLILVGRRIGAMRCHSTDNAFR